MAAAEQPLKKRKLYEQPPEPPSFPPPEPPPPPPPPQEPPPQPPTPPPLSQEEILRRRRGQEEIRNVFECYKRLNFYIDQKDKRFTPELEEAYLSLISASKGGASVQRLVAEYIPRYASYCPTALEAAANVVINMHNWCFTMISRGEDIDGIAFETAKACIFGLVDICQAAASEAPTSAVIQRICSAVFLNAFTFFMSSFEQKDIFEIVDQRVLKIHEAAESFIDFKRQILDEDTSVLLKLAKFRALSFLKIFFSCPKNSLVVCFELFESTGIEGTQKGNYFLHQLTNKLKDGGTHPLDEGCDEKHRTESCPASKGNSVSNSKSAILKNCLLGLVLGKDPSFKSWIFSRYRRLCDSASSEVVSHITSVLEGIFESFTLQVRAEKNQADGVENISGSSKYASPHLIRVSDKQGSPSVVSGRDCPDKLSGLHVQISSTGVNAGTDPFDGESKSMDFHYGDSGDHSNARTFMPRELLNRQSFSPRARTPRDFRSNSFNGRNHIEKSPIPYMELHSPALRSSSPFDSPKQNIPPPHSSTSHGVWYSDGDPTAMDIFPASRQLWLGSLGPDATEMLIRFQFEKFGPVDQFRYFPFKGFATIEYRNIMDALKAREVMRGHSPWGACLAIKFLDTGLGNRGAIHGTAVGSSCHVYVGNVSSRWAKDEMIHEVKKVLHKGPRMVFDLNGEGALLMEFDSPEEATISIAHLRWHRKENCNFFPPPSNVGPANVISRPVSSSIHPLEKPSESYHGANSLELTSPRMSQENRGPMMQQNAHAFQSTWTGGGVPGPSIAPPPQPVQVSNYNVRPFYAPPNSLWDARGMGHHMPPPHHANNLQAPPYLPASVTPLAQFDQRFPPPLSSLAPTHLNIPPPPPPPHSEPPAFPRPPPPPSSPPPPPPPAFSPPPPPPPSSPPPPPPSVSAGDTESCRSSQHYPWQGILSKSGVHYCTIHAQRVDSDICNYSNDVAEPVEWPAKLDMMKRTDLRHVKSTFSSTPSHRREICWLLPSSHADHKGFQDFVSYLKQRDCSGVIKIPAAKSMWARLLFILPYSPDMCSMLSIPPNPSLCLIGLILPKDTHSELP